MIQRVQSIFLFLIAVAMTIALLTPIWEKAGGQGNNMAHLSALQYTYDKGITTHIEILWYLALFIGLVGLIAVFTIFQFRNRIMQMGLCAANAILLTTIMGIILYRTVYIGKAYGNPGDQGTFQLGFWAVIAALLFNFLANRFIRRDERMVRDSNRIR